MRKVLIIGLGNQGEKYIKYFINDGKYEIFGVCKTIKTKKLIKSKYNILVSLDLFFLIKEIKFNLIIIALPLSIQGNIALKLLRQLNYNVKIIIEAPVSFNIKEVNLLKKKNNVFFFLEEYYFLLNKFFRKIHIKDITKINIKIFMNNKIFKNKVLKKINCIHINNNFLGLNIERNKINYGIELHSGEKVFYKIFFTYNKHKILFNYGEKIFLQIGKKIYFGNNSFNYVLSNLIRENNNFNKYFNLDNFCDF